MTEHGREEHEKTFDKYYTPKWVTRVLLDRINLDASIIGEPCAGQGHISEVLESNGFHTIKGDLDPESDYREVDATNIEQVKNHYEDCGTIITNPPYNADAGTASGVIKTLLQLNIPVIALLRITFLEPCNDRTGLLKKLDRVFTLPRFNFITPGEENKNQNPATSCWYIWNDNSFSESFDHTILRRKDVNESLGQTTIF